jgi:phage portal protein BeeE
MTMWPFKDKSQAIETRSSFSGYTADIMAAREQYLSGRQGIAELTATAQSCISMWEMGLALADVAGTELLDRRSLAMTARALALRGEAVFVIRETGLVACSDWDLKTRDGVPTAYRVQISEANGGQAETVLAAEVLHFRHGCDVVTPYCGTAPLKRAPLTAGLLNALEVALSEVFENAPLGSQVVPMPEMPEVDSDKLARAFRGNRGRVLIRESVNVTAAGGPAPAQDWKSADLSPDLARAMTTETLKGARDSILTAFGVLPALMSPGTTGQLVREAQRHLAGWTLQPLAMLIGEEATVKLGTPIMIDVMRPLQAFDAGARSRAFGAMITATADAKAAGLTDEQVNAMLTLINWWKGDNAA